MTNIYAALEIGTTRTVLAVAEAKTGSKLKLVKYAAINSSGIRKSQILDIKQATESIINALRSLEKQDEKSNDSITIGNAFLVISGQHIKTDPYTEQVQIEGSKVENRDIEEVLNATHRVILPNNRELLGIVDQNYVVDTISTTTPKGMSGRILKLNTLQIHGDVNRINDARTAASEAHLELHDPLFAAECAADAVLDANEKKNGTLVIDLGGGTTGYAVYIDGYLAAANVIGIGGDHISSDIAYAFQLTHNQAEELKKTEASAIVTQIDPTQSRITINDNSPLHEVRTISRHALNTIVNVRVQELLQIIHKELEELDLIDIINCGIVLTGGGAALNGIDALCAQKFRRPVRIGTPIHIDGLSNVKAPASLAAISGALMFAHRNYERKPFFSMLKGFFK